MTRRAATVLAAIVACAGCDILPRTRNPAYCDDSTQCADGFLCDIGATSGPPRHTCIESAPILPCGDASASTCDDAAPVCTGPTGCPIEQPVCTAAGACEPCAVDPECAPRPATPHCGPAGACVECRDSIDCAGNRPICQDRQCRACKLDSECPSLICEDETGACVLESAVAYVDAAATTAASLCSKTAPCKKVSDALALTNAERSWVRIAAGRYPEDLHISSGSVQLKGVPEATILQPPAIDHAVLVVDGTASVRLVDLVVRDASGSGGAGIRCSGTQLRPVVLSLRRVRVVENHEQGVDTTQCDVTILRSTISGNAGGGLSFTSSSFNVRNNFIVMNGTLGTKAIAIADAGGAQETKLDFNTIAGNGAGVACFTSTTLAFANNIVYGNGSGEQVTDNCAFTFSDIGPMTALTGDGNINVDPLFVPGDFHLQSSSQCIDAADDKATVREDFDGDPRPVNGRADIGADEHP